MVICRSKRKQLSTHAANIKNAEDKELQNAPWLYRIHVTEAILMNIRQHSDGIEICETYDFKLGPYLRLSANNKALVLKMYWCGVNCRSLTILKVYTICIKPQQNIPLSAPHLINQIIGLRNKRCTNATWAKWCTEQLILPQALISFWQFKYSTQSFFNRRDRMLVCE
jgi:hypothetical protein